MEQPFPSQAVLTLQERLLEKTGLYFTRERQDLLFQKVCERIQGTGDSGLEAYLSRLDKPGKTEEWEALVQALTIGETYFFREENQLRALRETLLPSLEKSLKLDWSGPRKIHVWCAGVSTGEEAYSLAMILSEFAGRHSGLDYRILATDLHEGRLETARSGIYGARALRQVPEMNLQRYLTRKNQSYHVSEELKKHIVFRHHNLATDSFFFAGWPSFDFILCRNVLIYFDVFTVKKILAAFDERLNLRGSLLLGASESLWGISNLFVPMDVEGAFVYRKNQAGEFFGQTPEAGQKISQIAARPFALEKDDLSAFEKDLPAKPSASQAIWRQAVCVFQSKDPHQALELFNQLLAAWPADSRVITRKSVLLANQGHEAEAIECLETITKHSAVFAPAYYLKGLLHFKREEYDIAMLELRRAVFLEPGLVVAYFQMGNIYRQRKENKKASKEYAFALRLLEKADSSMPVSLADGLSSGEFASVLCKIMTTLKAAAL